MTARHISATIGGRKIDFTDQTVRQVMSGVEPTRIHKYYVEVDGVRFPPKQIIAALTGWELMTFNTQEAQRVLGRAGFPLGPDPEALSARFRSPVPHVNGSYARVVDDSLLVGRTVYDKTGEPVSLTGVGVRLNSVEIWGLIGELEKLAERLEQRGE